MSVLHNRLPVVAVPALPERLSAAGTVLCLTGVLRFVDSAVCKRSAGQAWQDLGRYALKPCDVCKAGSETESVLT
jgi:hypothetical protein